MKFVITQPVWHEGKCLAPAGTAVTVLSIAHMVHSELHDKHRGGCVAVVQREDGGQLAVSPSNLVPLAADQWVFSPLDNRLMVNVADPAKTRPFTGSLKDLRAGTHYMQMLYRLHDDGRLENLILEGHELLNSKESPLPLPEVPSPLPCPHPQG